jgi:hypothetical protein
MQIQPVTAIESGGNIFEYRKAGSDYPAFGSQGAEDNRSGVERFAA